jgi:hypothetical protein
MVPLRMKQVREIVHAGERVGVVRSKNALVAVEDATVERRGPGVVPLRIRSERWCCWLMHFAVTWPTSSRDSPRCCRPQPATVERVVLVSGPLKPAIRTHLTATATSSRRVLIRSGQGGAASSYPQIRHAG